MSIGAQVVPTVRTNSGVWRALADRAGAASWALAALGVAASVWGAFAAIEAQSAAVAAEFNERASQRIRAVAEVLHGTSRDLVALQSLYLSSQEVERGEFSSFAQNLLSERRVQVLEWAPRVTAADRASFEVSLGRPIRELRDGALVVADDRAEYVPIAFVVPEDGSATFTGFDLASDPVRRAALDQAARTGHPVSTGRIDLVQGGYGFLTVAPVRSAAASPGGAPEGYVVGVTGISALLSAALSELPRDGVVVSLYDDAAGVGARFLGRFPDEGGVDSAAPVGVVGRLCGVVDVCGPYTSAQGPQAEGSIALDGGVWRVVCTAGPAFRSTAHGRSPMFALVGGLSMTALLVGYVRLLMGRTAEARADADRLSREIDERIQAEGAARESEEKFRALAEEAPVGVFVLQAGTFRYVNPCMAEMFGLSVHAIVDRLGPRDLLSEEDVLALDATTSTGGRPELVLRRPGGDRTLEAYATPAAFGGRAAVLGTLLDVTARRRAEAEHHRVERLESLGLLAGGIAHDFNNLLATVLGNVSLAALSVPEGSAPATRLADAMRAVERARGLTAQLQTFSRGGSPILEPTDLGATLREMTRFALTGSAVVAEFDIAGDLWPVSADATQIAGVVQNLVLNASQAMGGRGRVVVRAYNRPHASGSIGEVVFEIVDSGEGMTDAVRERVFDPYFTTKPSGTGLGLASAHSIVRRHGGTMAVVSQVGVGSTFTVVLPAIARAPERGPSVDVSAGRRASVLVMDDDPDVRSVAVRLLESLGYTVEGTADGGEAVARYRDHLEAGSPFDVVVLDLTVPGGVGGRDALIALRAIDPAVRAVASSGYSSDPVMADHTQYGFVAVLPKPYSRANLAATLDAVFAR
jgi:PAS domain S-box-containing protein